MNGISGVELAGREWIIALPVRVIGQGLAFLHLEVDGNLFVCLSLNNIVNVFGYREFVLLVIILHLYVFHVVVIRLKVNLRLHELQPFQDRFVVLEELLVLNDEFGHENWHLVAVLEWEVIRQHFNANVTKQLLTLDDLVDVLIVKTGFKNQKVDGLV